MTGWNAITNTFLKMYPKQTEPLHFAPLFSYQLGGDPLDSINVYESDDFYHFVSYGLSELYEKESEDKEYSGYGFEFTLKLKKSSLNNAQNELECVCGIFQTLAGETFSNGSIFQPFEYIYTGQANGIDSEGMSNITGSGTTRRVWGCIFLLTRLDWRVVILRYTDMFSTPIHRLTHLDWIVTK